MLELTEHIKWRKGRLVILDQTLLPTQTRYVTLRRAEEVWEAIKVLRVRGAPAIGVTAAYGLYLGVSGTRFRGLKDFLKRVEEKGRYLESSRPTAVNLRWAVQRVIHKLKKAGLKSVEEGKEMMLEEAHSIFDEDHQACKQIGIHGSKIIKNGFRILTHCNAGGLATARYGTALAPVYLAFEKGVKVSVYADETRPLLQGARLTAYELQKAGIPVTVICDNMAAVVMAEGKVDMIIVGADRIASNGDFANKIGTYGLAILAREHRVPFYCAAPLSTIDMNLENGSGIPIEERKPEEVSFGFGRQTVPKGVKIYNPAFDVTPFKYVAGFITEKGIVRAPYRKNLKKLFQ